VSFRRIWSFIASASGSSRFSAANDRRSDPSLQATGYGLALRPAP
jgi:hypothetical protein